MDCSGTLQIAERVPLECELRDWFLSQGVSQEGSARALELLDRSTLLAQPRPSRWNRRGEFGVQERCRYLWYRHAARILGWCDRRRFPDLVTCILRQHVFPSRNGQDEAPREVGAGRVTAGHHARPIANAADRRTAGQSCCLHTCEYAKVAWGKLGFRLRRACRDCARRASR